MSDFVPPTYRERREDRWDYIDHLHRITQFRKWLDSNILFPTVPDDVVKPLRAELIKAEEILVAKAYVSGHLDKLAAMQKVR